MKTFKELLAVRDSKGNYLLGNHKDKLSSPRFRWWFWACRDWIDSGGETIQPQDLFRANPYKQSVAEAHLELALLIRDKVELSDKLALIAQKYFLPTLMVEELARELSGEPLRTFERKVNLQVLFAESADMGISAVLELDLINDGSGEVYPAPAMAFIHRSEDFVQSEQQALELLKFPKNKDVRWRLIIAEDRLFPSEINGNSMGAAFGLGMWLLLNEEESNYPNWMGVAASAQLGLDGHISPVDKIFAKLLEAARTRSLPAIHTVLTANTQDLSDIIPNYQGPERIYEHRDIQGLFHLVQAGELLRAAQVVRTHLDSRWALNNDFEFVFEQNKNIVGRAWIRDHVHDFILNSNKRFLVLTAGPGFGKTGIITDLIEKDHKQRLDSGFDHVFGIYHFIKRQSGDLNDPSAILQSLIVQIRRLFALEEVSAEHFDRNDIPVDAFRSVLNRASEKLRENHFLVIYLDGLDEAFGLLSSGKARLDQVIPLDVPHGIKFVMTSRPSSFLDCLADPKVAQNSALDEFATDQSDDIRNYLSLRIEQLHNEGIAIDKKLLNDLLRAAEGNFMVAVQYLENRPGLLGDIEKWMKNPKLIPVGLKDWLSAQWSTLVRAAKSRCIDESQFRLALGLVAFAEESLSFAQWEEIITRIPTKWAIDHSIFEKSLEVAQEYFDPHLFSQQKYRFIHNCISEFIREKQKGQDGERIDSVFAHIGMKCWNKEGHLLQDYSLAHLSLHMSRASDWEELLHQMLNELNSSSSTRLSSLAADSMILLGRQESRKAKVYEHGNALMNFVSKWFNADKQQKSYLANVLLQVACELPYPEWITRLGCHRHSDIRTLAISRTYFLWKKDKELCLKMLKKKSEETFYLPGIPRLRHLEFLFGSGVIILSGHPEDQKTVKVLLKAGNNIIKRMKYLWPASYVFIPFVSELIRQIPDDYNPINPVEYRYAKDEIQSDAKFQQRAIRLNKLLLDSKIDTQKYRELIEELIDHHPGNVIIISILCLLQFKVALDDFDEALDIGIMTAEKACGKSVTVFQSAVYQLFFMCIGSRKPNQDQYQRIKELWGRYYEHELFDFGFKPKWTKWRRFRSLFGYKAKEPYLNIWISGFGLLIAKMENFVHLEDDAKLREIFLRYDLIAQHKGDEGKYDTAAKAFLRGLDIVGAEIGSMDKDGLRFSQATLIYILNHKVPPSDPELEMIAKTLVRFQALRPEEAMSVIDRVKDPQLRAKLVQFKNKCKYRENMGGLIGTRIAEFYRHAFQSEHWNREFFKMYQAFIEKRFFYQGIRQMARMVLCGLRDYESKSDNPRN